ncbi:MAG: VCBS repeat-containing protein [Planctomycetota bacterium]
MRSSLVLACVGALMPVGCEKKAPPSDANSNAEAVQPPQPTREPDRQAALLLAQAQFVEQKTADGKTRPIPGPAKLIFVYPDGGRWTPEVLEDHDGNVFHKAMAFDPPGGPPGILTISANKAPRPAMLKVWHRTANGWKGTLLWEAHFGGNFNRFRDVEVGDVTGDGRPEIVVATHDQGVVAVLQETGGTWNITEIDRAPNIFVHEIEIGDVDGDGRNEIFATPSARNKVDGTPQPGWVVMYRHDGEKFSRQVVEEFDARHVKELLVADVHHIGRADLYAVLEVQLGQRSPPNSAEENVEIKQYHFTGAEASGALIATLPDKQCRFLHVGDVDADGKAELVASAFRSGIWIIRPEGETWAAERIDDDSSGYEHATALADLDGDGKLEIYAAADDQQQLRRYCWNGATFERTDLFKLTKGDITFGLMPCSNPACLGNR